LPSGMEVAIFRVVQEAFSNVLKHSQASHVTLELTYQQQMVKVTVKDNGIGFVVEQIDKKIDKGSHYGLMGMRERVELLEGRMEVESDVGAGAKVSMLIPIKLESKEG
jgi:two-component system sensor histidine kinase DegS